MVETPALLSRPPAYVGMATTALVLGCVGIVLPGIGVLIGIVAIILGIIAVTHKTTHFVPALIGIITGAIAIMWSILAVFLVVHFFSTSHSLFPPSARDDAVTAQENERKDFGVGETAKMGPIDFKVTSYERNYQLPVIDAKNSDLPVEVLPNQSEYYTGTPIAEADAEYVLVEASASINHSASLGDDDFSYGNFELNNVAPYSYSGPNKYDVDSQNRPIRYVFRIRKGSDTLVMSHQLRIYKHISIIVGTEGMPQDLFTYTLKVL